jgi:hypothetical protein
MNQHLELHGELFFATGVCYGLLGSAACFEVVASLRRIYRVVGWDGSAIFYASIMKWKVGFLVSVALYGWIYAWVLIRNIGMGVACPVGAADPSWTFRMRFSLLVTIAEGCALLGFACAIRLWEDVLCAYLPDVDRPRRRRIIAVSAAASIIPLIISSAVVYNDRDGCQPVRETYFERGKPSVSLWWTLSELITHLGNLALGLLFLSFARRVQSLTLTAYPIKHEQLVLKKKVRKLIATMCLFTLCFLGQIIFGITSLVLSESLDHRLFVLSCGCGNGNVTSGEPSHPKYVTSRRIPLSLFIGFECLVLIIPLSVLLYLFRNMNDKIIIHNWQAAQSRRLTYEDRGDSPSCGLHLHMLTSMDNSIPGYREMRPEQESRLQDSPHAPGRKGGRITVQEANKRFALAQQSDSDGDAEFRDGSQAYRAPDMPDTDDVVIPRVIRNANGGDARQGGWVSASA